MPTICTTAITLGTLRIDLQATREVAFRTLQAQFGDGYLARRQDGINPVIETWNVSTPPRPISELQAVETELINLAAGFFTWTPPYETTSKKWILYPNKWSWRYMGDEKATISFTLRRFYV